jgi:hypothetical protein
MATFAELLQAQENPDLRKKVTVACIMAAEAVGREAPATTLHAERLKWASKVFENPDREAGRMFWAVLARVQTDTPGATLAQILAATDAAVLTSVTAEVNVFAAQETVG